ncbi:unnamed protein product [Nippostrongylus brasiliensis]|uniref:Peptidase_M14 domain-containing protein n=1 Tax=Nippostrongylus brasiliensis TaxID=27835 RepID=A0A0N4XR47_NIPBR|nr:unnamed protein product [Nippostrongylus brasiliensis]
MEGAIEGEKSSPGFYHPEADGYSYNKYNSLEDIHKELLRLRKEKPEMISLIDIGESHENRTLLVAKVSGHKSAIEQKISMWLDAGIHAREWIAPATAMQLQLVSGYESDPSIQKLLDHIDFYILPVMNPDGYEYSREKVSSNELIERNVLKRIPLGKRMSNDIIFRTGCGGKIVVLPPANANTSILFAAPVWI